MAAAHFNKRAARNFARMQRGCDRRTPGHPDIGVTGCALRGRSREGKSTGSRAPCFQALRPGLQIAAALP